MAEVDKSFQAGKMHWKMTMKVLQLQYNNASRSSRTNCCGKFIPGTMKCSWFTVGGTTMGGCGNGAVQSALCCLGYLDDFDGSS